MSEDQGADDDDDGEYDRYPCFYIICDSLITGFCLTCIVRDGNNPLILPFRRKSIVKIYLSIIILPVRNYVRSIRTSENRQNFSLSLGKNSDGQVNIYFI